MNIDRSKFREKFSGMPAWHCPTCATGTLHEVTKERLIAEPAYSKAEHIEDWWGPEHIINRYCARMQCANPACGEFVFVIGSSDLEPYYSEEGEEWSDRFQPTAAYPYIPVFRLRDDWPGSVQQELKLAFANIWSDAGASANRLRTAVECLLDFLKVKKISVSTKFTPPKKIKLSLHDRIIVFKSNNIPAAELLLAIKWLGNAGSHTDLKGISRDAVLDGMELMEHVLHLLFDKNTAAISKLAKSINKKKGPIYKSPKKTNWSF